MNLKEAFRYQKFLNTLCQSATYDIGRKDYCLKTVRNHLISKADPDKEDEIEVVPPPMPRGFSNDDLLKFMLALSVEKEKITIAINRAKQEYIVENYFDIDAGMEKNKMMRTIADGIRTELSHEPRVTKETGTGYKFNIEGNQSPYRYNIEVSYEDAYDRKEMAAALKELLKTADEISAEIDSAMINQIVYHKPLFDINSKYSDAVVEFISEGLKSDRESD